MKNENDLQDIYDPQYWEPSDVTTAFIFTVTVILILVAVFA